MARRILATLAAVSLLALSALLALWPAAPAAAHGGEVALAAHGGEVVLDVAGDGAAGVTVRATYERDGHPVEDRVLRLVLNATGEGGRAVGPLQLNPANEGRGFYSSGAVLTPGAWTVVITSPAPNPGKAEARIEARAAQTAPAPEAAPEPPVGSGGGTWRGWTAGAAVLLGAVIALAVIALAVVSRRRSRTPADR